MSQYLQQIDRILESKSAIIILILIALIWFAREYLRIRKEMKQLYEQYIKLLWEQSEFTRMLIGVLIGTKVNKKIIAQKKTKRAGRKKSSTSL